MAVKKIISIFIVLTMFVFAVQAQTRTSVQGISKIKFYPNPATSFIQFEFSDNTDLSGATFKIFNFIGKKVFETDQIKSRTVVNLNDFFRGVYIFQLTDRQGRILESSKFQVQK